MKVCFLSTTHPFDDTRVLHKEAHALAKAGHCVTHIAPMKGGADSALPQAFEASGVKIVLYGSGRRYRRFLRLFRLAWQQRADCYHCNEVDSWLLGLLLKLLRPGAKIVFDVHEHYPSRFAEPHVSRWLRHIGPPLMGAILKVLPWFTDFVILAKRSVAGDFPKRYDRKDFVFNYGVTRIAVRTAEQIPEDVKKHFREGVFTAVHVGGISRARGWPQLLEALSLTTRPVHALCLGSVLEGTDTLMAEARRLGVEDRITVLDRVPYEQMFDFLSLGHVGLMLYQPGILNHTYAFPMKLYDYMWAGLPSIGPDFAIEVEPVIREVGCGICIDTSDSRALAKALDTLAADPDSARTMGQRGREAVLAKYNWEAEARKLVAIYERLARE